MSLTSEEFEKAERSVAHLRPKADNPVQAAVKAIGICFIFSMVCWLAGMFHIPTGIREIVAAAMTGLAAYADRRSENLRYSHAHFEAVQEIFTSRSDGGT